LVWLLKIFPIEPSSDLGGDFDTNQPSASSPEAATPIGYGFSVLVDKDSVVHSVNLMPIHNQCVGAEHSCLIVVIWTNAARLASKH